jgi:uncharacterized Fe-S cluster-containing protein
MSGDNTLRTKRLNMIDTVLFTLLHATKSTNYATTIGASFSGLTRWLNQDCACSRLFLAWRKLTRAATHSRPARPAPAPIPAFAPVLRLVEVEGTFTSAMGAVVVVGVAAVLAESDGEVEVEDVEVVLLDGVEDEDVELVLLDEVDDEDVDSVVTVVFASM